MKVQIVIFKIIKSFGVFLLRTYSWSIICCLICIPRTWFPSLAYMLSSQLHNSSPTSGTSKMSLSSTHKLCKTHAERTESTSMVKSDDSNPNSLLNLHFNIPKARSMTCLHWLWMRLNLFCCWLRLPQSRNGVISHSMMGKAESPKMQ